jgi:hypothetical protein
VRGFFLLLLLSNAAPAAACPRTALCLATEAHAIELSAPAVHAASLAPAAVAAHVERRTTDALARALRAAPERQPDVAMPWIWQTLRREVYRRMPRYSESRFTMVASPVVVSSTFDTVPGLGVEGDF